MSRYALYNRAGELVGLTWADTAGNAMRLAKRFGVREATTATREAE